MDEMEREEFEMSEEDILSILFLLFSLSVILFICVTVYNVKQLLSALRIVKLKRMLYADKNDYQKIFLLLKRIKRNDFNQSLNFRVSYNKTGGDKWEQHEFKKEKPFVSLGDLKSCNTLEELTELIDETKIIIEVKYSSRGWNR